jgi:hypothetical protein
MNTEDELVMWSQMLFELHKVPNDLRTMNHTAFVREVEGRIAELENEVTK